MLSKEPRRPDDTLWYKDAVIYELHVKSFCDSDGDGVGDFVGLTGKLNYLQSLGITAIWLLPFYPSPLRDDGYDIADYFQVNPQFGTLRDFKTFLREAHRRGLRVITELVLNHTSDQHAWFKAARKAKPGSALRDFYVWSDTPEKYKDARIIFTDFETSNWAWDREAKAYYWHRFYSHQPDLNFDNPAVVKVMMKVLDYWFAMGVDGMRLDAVPYLFEREGTNCENLPETYRYLEVLRAHVDSTFKDKVLIAEANQWPEDAVAYFGTGNRCHMAFHFPVMPRLFMASWMEDRFPVVDIFDQTPAIPENCQWAIFLRNHDELTLEMVSDEERDYMYSVYARDPSARINLGIRRRLAPLFNNNRAKIELMNILLFSLPGTPVLYYGDEICMGDNHYLGDRNGVRTPMQWSADRNAGFSSANPQRLFLPVIIDPDYHFESVNVENQERNQSSPLWWMKRVITMRNRFKAFGRGSIEFLNSDNPKILAFIRQYQDEIILVVANLSRFSQVVTLDLSKFEGYIPQEVGSGNRFPSIKSSPYVFTLTFHDYFWFLLLKPEYPLHNISKDVIPMMNVAGRWQSVLQGKAKERLERDVLGPYLQRQLWFGGRSRTLLQTKIVEVIHVGDANASAELAMVEVRYAEGANETYMLPLVFVLGEKAEKIKESPQAIVAYVNTGTAEGVLCDAPYDSEFRKGLLEFATKKQSRKAQQGKLVVTIGDLLKARKPESLPLDDSHVIAATHSNTSLVYGREFLIKMFRRLDDGINPELEIGRYLTEKVNYTRTPAFAGAIEYKRTGFDPITLGIIRKFIPNQGDALSFMANAVTAYFEGVLAKRNENLPLPPLAASLLEIITQDTPLLLQELIGGVCLEMTGLLGRRTAELHLSLATPTDDPKFAGEAFTLHYQRSLYHSLRTLTKRVFELLRKNLKTLDEPIRTEAEVVLKYENAIIKRFANVAARKITATKFRVHGDYRLQQILNTGNDFFILDFEGDPMRKASERRLKRSPLLDVVGMIRSFPYPAYSVLLNSMTFTSEDVKRLEPWAEIWSKCVAATFLKSYLLHVGDAPFMPKDRAELQLLLEAYTLEKIIDEIRYGLSNRSNLLAIPLQAMKKMMS